MQRKAEPLIRQFWRRVDASGECWLWQGPKKPTGYGSLTVAGQRRAAHRVAYELEVGPIPEGLELDHLCRVRHCVRPDHLEPVSHRENLMRSIRARFWRDGRPHCRNGHEFTTENMHTTPRGTRRCRACHRVNSAASKARRRERNA